MSIVKDLKKQHKKLEIEINKITKQDLTIERQVLGES